MARRGGELRRQEFAEDLRRRALFALSMLRDPRAVGAVWPTSRRAVEDLLEMADLGGAGLVVEFGAGTGVYTEGILRRLGPEARLLSYEVDGRMAEAVARRLPDRRLEVVHASAEEVNARLDALTPETRATMWGRYIAGDPEHALVGRFTCGY